MRTTLRICAAAAALVMVDCGAASDSGAPDVAWRDGQLNGSRLNSFRLNSFRLNSLRLDGDPGTGDFIEITEVDLKGSARASKSWLQGSDLVVQTEDGEVRIGGMLADTRIDFSLHEGKGNKKKEVKIVGATPLAPGSDVMLYDLDLRYGSGKWEPLCIDGAGARTEAVLLCDSWDPATGEQISPTPTDVVTFACRGAALAKCAEWGYRPWAAEDGVSLRDYHQACTRMVRADYCGDGVPHTEDGTPIHVLDALGIQTVDPATPYVVEAEWGPDGATCLNLDNTRIPDVVVDCELPACGSAFASGGLIQSGTVVQTP